MSGEHQARGFGILATMRYDGWGLCVSLCVLLHRHRQCRALITSNSHTSVHSCISEAATLDLLLHQGDPSFQPSNPSRCR